MYIIVEGQMKKETRKVNDQEGGGTIGDRTDWSPLTAHPSPSLSILEDPPKGGGEQNKTNDGENPTWKEQWMGEWMRIDPTN